MMTTENIGQMLELLEGNYGQKFYEGTDRKKVLNLWRVMFQDDDPREVAMAVQDCISTLQFPPKISDIKTRIAKQKMAGQMTEIEAWSKIVTAINLSYGKDDANQQFYQLPPILQKLVSTPDQLRAWRSVDEAQLQTVVMSTVMRGYRELVQRELTYHSLPAEAQQQAEWQIAKPVMEALPEPKREQTLDEMEDEMDRSAREYREKYLLPELKEFLPQHYANIMEKLRGCG